MAGTLIAYKVHNPAVADVYTFNNTTLNDPIPVKVDAADMVLPAFTTGSDGHILARLNCYIVSTASAADNFFKWCLLNAADAIVLPNDAAAGSSHGRRVALQHDVAHRAKLETEIFLAPNTSYTLFWGAVCGNQAFGGGGGNNFIMKAGGVFGPATMEIWDLAGAQG